MQHRISKPGVDPLSPSERHVLEVFGKFLMTPGQMLCFCGPELAQYRASFERLVERQLLDPERYKGGYSLTEAGFTAMKSIERSL